MKEVLKKRASELKTGFKTQTAAYIAAAFGLVAGLAWNDAIRSFIEYFFPLGANTLIMKFIYAFVITIVVTIVTTYIVKQEQK